jgi:hypothetical protein
MHRAESEPSYWFALAAEDAEHHAAVTRLTDRVLEEKIEWFSPEIRDAIRGWRHESPLNPYWKVTGATDVARALGLPLRGHFEGKQELEAAMYRAQLLVWQHAHVHGQSIHVGFIVRDTDHKPRRKGAESAAKSGRWPFVVVLAFPHPEAEAWRIAVYRPAGKAAEERVAELTRRLGFSPIEHPEKLSSTVTGGVGDAKTIREALCPDDDDGWLEIDLHELRERGKSCGLADFLAEVEAVVVPLLAGGKTGST